MTHIPKFELKKQQTDLQKVKLKSVKDVVKYIRQFYDDDISIYESVFILMLNRAGYTIGYAKISQGGCVGAIVDVKIVLQYAVLSMAQAIVLCHNHPSGNKQPSKHDINLTKALKNSLRTICDCELMDHIILTEEDYYSFAQAGKL